MTDRQATCSCGNLVVRTRGEPVRVSICHCLACQKRTGSVFAAQARFALDAVTIEGQSREYVRIGGSGSAARFEVLRRVRRHRVLAGRRPSGLRHRGGRCFRGPGFSPAAGVGLLEKVSGTILEALGFIDSWLAASSKRQPRLIDPPATPKPPSPNPPNLARNAQTVARKASCFASNPQTFASNPSDLAATRFEASRATLSTLAARVSQSWATV